MGESATPLQAQVLRACDVWRRPAELQHLLRAPCHLLQRLLLLGWLEAMERTPARRRPDRGQHRRWRLYRTTARGKAALPAAEAP